MGFNDTTSGAPFNNGANPQSEIRNPQPTISPARLGGAIFVFSVAAALYTLAIFRLLTFFIMPSIFFDLLLVGFPIGAGLAARRGSLGLPTFRRALVMLQLVMGATILLTLLCKHLDHMRAQLLFHVDPWKLLQQILSFSGLYLPFFVAYGAAEYTGYVAGRSQFAQQMKLAYALCLFGGAVALTLSDLLLQYTGLVRLLIASVGLVSLAAVLADARRVGHAVVMTIVAGLCAVPRLDNHFMALFKSQATGSVADAASITHAETVYSAWGRYAFFEVMQAPPGMEASFAGFYNDIGQWYYFPPSSRIKQFRELALAPFLKRCESAAVVGSGGGRDVALALQTGVKRILAVELEPRVVKAVRHELAAAFEHIYDQPGVEVRVGDARKVLANSPEQFDAILFWSVGGYPQLMLEPGNMIRTIEALGMFLDRLTDRGVFIMGYDESHDPERVLLRQYYATLTQLGAQVHGFQSATTSRELLLVAVSPNASESQRSHWESIIKQLPGQVEPIHPSQMTMTGFKPVTDDRPYLAGNIRTVLPPEHVQQLFLALGLLLLLLGVLMVWYMRSHYRLRTGDALSVPLMTVSFLVGSNFILLEHQLILAIFRHHFVYYDSLLVGVVAFLLMTGLGSLVIGPKHQVWCLLLGMSCAALLWSLVSTAMGQELLSNLKPLSQQSTGSINVTRWAVQYLPLLLFVPVIVVSGRFFPAVFDAEPRAQLYVFGMDALGAAAGALLAFFVPILMGISTYEHAATAVFLLTSVSVLLFLVLRGR